MLGGGDFVGGGGAALLELLEGGEVLLGLGLLVLGALEVSGDGDALVLGAAVGDVLCVRFGGAEGGGCGGDAGGGVAVGERDEEFSGSYLVADADVDFFDDPCGGGVGLELFDGLDLAVGGDGADEVLVSHPGGADLDTVAEGVAVGEDGGDEDYGDRNPEDEGSGSFWFVCLHVVASSV